MSVKLATIVTLPRVLDDGSLEFDPSGNVPTAIPLFRKEGNRFYPEFKPCIYRTLTERPLTNAPG